jgi:hypothetical protein
MALEAGYNWMQIVIAEASKTFFPRVATNVVLKSMSSLQFQGL